MTIQTLIKKLNTDVEGLRKDVQDIKVLLAFSLVKDPEGEYKTSFTKEISKRAARKGARAYNFTTKEAFLKHVQAK